jgi:hypothetical protein
MCTVIVRGALPGPDQKTCKLSILGDRRYAWRTWHRPRGWFEVVDVNQKKIIVLHFYYYYLLINCFFYNIYISLISINISLIKIPS